ncbi:MAG: VOC family protein [Candidatus Manganitrophus sp.]|nr:VOC family protein [Candidatus Manganitrophus sp.]MDC4226082.1 VOC family protein [Candidatus Manganitrophus sp.]WDT72663.1 MAG: VOC family protein [Candidatus Manganitrophus sp.]WDT79874.1 MAG: VOC family protein [Candidatus Manganitrophus sp.]
MQSNPVNWFEIYVQDIDRAKRFYEAVFQITFQKLNAPFPGVELWGFPADMNRYGAAGALVKMEGFASGGNATLVYFSCDDCAVEAERAARTGGQIKRPKTSIGEYGQIALVTDTEGNMIGLHSMK